MQIEIKKLNEILSKIQNFEGTYRKVASESNGEYQPSTTTIYDVGDGLFLKEVIWVDSYGENSEITELQFVQPISKNITEYETIN